MMELQLPAQLRYLRRTALMAAAAMMLATAPAAPQSGTVLLPPEHLLCLAQSEPLAVADAHPELSWEPRAQAGHHGVTVSGWQIQVAQSAQTLARDQAILWDSGRQSSAPQSRPATAYAGPALAQGQSYWWRVRLWDGQGRASAWSPAAHFQTAPEWQARWIEAPAAKDADPLPLFRRGFELEAPVRRATLHIAGLGQYEAHINGQHVGIGVLTPGWSDYRKTIFFDSYDVTPLVHQGANAMGVALGNGFFRVTATKGRYTKLTGSYGAPRLIAQLEIELENGRRLRVVTDPEWKSAPGPIVFTSIYGGEDYDARREQAGWNRANFDDRAWQPVVLSANLSGALTPEVAPLSTILRRTKPVRITTPKAGVEVYDLGQNLAGWPAITVAGSVGSTVRMTPGELLNPDGTVSQRSSGKPVWFSYTLKGEKQSQESWHPRFSYYGFRYVQVETTGDARVVQMEGQTVSTSSPVVGTFTSSSELLNKIHALILRSIENNAQSLLTDCPHREKLGWLEQTHLLAPSVLYNFDARGIYRALAINLADAQKTNGAVPEIAPQYVVFEDKWGPFNDSPEWGSAIVLAPWYLYQQTGEVEPLLAAAPAMRRYVDYLESRATEGIVSYGLGDWYDIGPKPPGVSQLTTPGLTATAIYYQDLTVVARVLHLAGDTAAAQHYAALAERTRSAFQKKFFDPKLHRYDTGSQTAQAMPLALGLVPEGEEPSVLKSLIDDIHAHTDHGTAGDIGYRYVVDALTQYHQSDLMMKMLQRTDAPSYGYQLAQGATALTEAWDANPASSQDHFMLGDAEQWFYQLLGGIRIDHSAERETRLTIAPELAGDLQSVRTTYTSAWGEIASAWQRHADSVEYRVTIPVNTVARMRIATPDTKTITVNGKPALHAAGVLKQRPGTDEVELQLGSGDYRILASPPRSTLTPPSLPSR